MRYQRRAGRRQRAREQSPRAQYAQTRLGLNASSGYDSNRTVSGCSVEIVSNGGEIARMV